MKKIFLFYISFFIYLVSFSHNPLITELLVDPSIGGDRSEWIEIYNKSDTPILIDGWKITDGEGVWTIPANNYYLYPQGKITFSMYADSFYKQYGYYPDFAAYPGSSGVRPLTVSGSFALANTGDQVYLKNSNDSIIDCFAYITKYTTANPESVWYPISITPVTDLSYIRWPEDNEGVENYGEVSESLSTVWNRSSGQITVGPDTGGLNPSFFSLKNHVRTPASPTFLDDVVISCNAFSDTTIEYIKIFYSTNDFYSKDSILMAKIDDTTYVETIPAFPVHTDLRYYIKGYDSKNRTRFLPPLAPTDNYRYIVIDTLDTFFDVHFNKTVEETLAIYNIAEDTSKLDLILCEYIHRAQKTIDCCFYDFDRRVVADSLVAAHNRGVKIRFITDKDNRTLPEVAQLESAGIKVIDDDYPLTYSGSNIMHNKFCIIDTFVTFTGSWNITDNCTESNANNSIIIKDRQVAENYIKEFSEMWGSNTLIPDSTKSKFSTQKSDNITHKFIVSNDTVEVYMSPSDGVASKIINAISTANKSIYFCIFSFSHQGICDAMKTKYDGGVTVRGVFDETYWNADYSKSLDMRGIYNSTSSNNPWSPPADVFKDSVSGNLLHHKYMLIDADLWNSNPIVITGSYNWSDAAETGNDENCVILHSKYFAEMFLQEFAARYLEAGGTGKFSIDTKLENINIKAKREKEDVIIEYDVDDLYFSKVLIEYQDSKVFESRNKKDIFVHKNKNGGTYNLYLLRTSGVKRKIGSVNIDSFGKDFLLLTSSFYWSQKNPYRVFVDGSGKIKVSVINTLGQKVLKKDFDVKGKSEIILDEDLPEGIYYIRFENDGKEIVDKVVRIK